MGIKHIGFPCIIAKKAVYYRGCPRILIMYKLL